jgi:polysaccharide biosynthesis/export protein
VTQSASRRQHIPLRPLPTRLIALAVAGSVMTGMWGCETDSFLDPSVTGRWEPTPTVMPVLDRLSVIEDEPGELVQSTPIQPEDLIPEIDAYRFGPGDQIEIRIRDFFTLGVEEIFERSVDTRGFVEIPRLPAVRAQGRTTAELTSAIEEAIRGQRINDRLVVTVNPRSQRKQTFNALGAVRNPGAYFIPAADYRLLEAITAAGGLLDENQSSSVFVIRQVALSDEAAGVLPAAEPTGGGPGGLLRPRLIPGSPTPVEQAPAPKRSEELIELIDELSKPSSGEVPADKPAPSVIQPRGGQSSSGSAIAASLVSRRGNQPTEPVIDLPDTGDSSFTASSGRSGWIYVDGKWVKVNGAQNPSSAAGRRQMAQRVIKVPVAQLLAGSADVNIVLRPGDVIRVPPAKTGLVYLAGQIARPGPYGLPLDGKLTLIRAIDAAGGLGGLAIPERVDLTRVVGEGRQATIRLNLRAIAEQTQPDIYVKPDDRINVGTNFFAVPLAVFRGGFRASYGFGFILDRNFQGDVFGVDQAVTTIR